MKSRGQLMDPSDDWVDGSWTVDCVCGVNFDDGEEMVNCDECGVWVHTRCSRYVKSEKSFACDKCKSKNNMSYSEETEVAQLLVDLPNKTIKMDAPYRSGDPPRRPLRLWTEKPVEDRVHVHGIPGGDPKLFSGLSGGIFTPQLWKCTGYVPKKFNYRYKEFPCWDDAEEIKGKGETENQSPTNKGADALFSMSKETVAVMPRLSNPLGTRGSEKGEDFSAKESKRLSCVNLAANFSQPRSENEKGILRSLTLSSSKHRKDDVSSSSQDESGKRKARAFDSDIDTKKRTRHSSGTVFSPASDPKNLESSGDKESKFLRNSTQSTRKDYLAHQSQDTVLDRNAFRENNIFNAKKNFKFDQTSEAHPADASNSNSPTQIIEKDEKSNVQVLPGVERYGMPSSAVIGLGQFTLKEGIVGASVGKLHENQRDGSAAIVYNEADMKLSSHEMDTAVPLVQESQILPDLNANVPKTNLQPKLEVHTLSSDGKVDVDNLNQMPLVGQDPVKCGVDDKSISYSQSSGNEKQIEMSSNISTKLHSSGPKEPSDDRLLNQVDGYEGCETRNTSSLEKNHGSESVSEIGRVTDRPAPLPSQRKIVVSVGRSTSTNCFSKSVASDNGKSEHRRNPDTSIKQQVATSGAGSFMKKSAGMTADRDSERHQNIEKESSKASTSSIWKSSDSSRHSRSYKSKQTRSRSRDFESRSYSKTKQDNVATSDSGESDESQQAQGASMQNKITSSGSSGSQQRGEKHNQLNNKMLTNTGSKTSSHQHPLPTSHAALSDEELALLLHQELNSSPRVPRIPRMRQAGNLPQSASPTAASMIIKRTSSFGGKDSGLVSRRSSKDACKDETQVSDDEVDDNPRRTHKASHPRGLGIWESAPKLDTRAKGELDERSSKTNSTIKRKASLPGNVGKGHILSRSSQKKSFDEQTGIRESPAYRTLPGLISEIMSAGRRMTYDELCNAVLPHWHNLRKHNGERYAYSSHSQAVLDCLRNRSEWAQLVDRGPKTNPGRKKRKLDTEAATSGSEGGEVRKDRTVKLYDNKNISKSCHDEFPKGKRKARKRRRLALQGREVKDLRKRRRAGVVSEEEEDDDDDDDDDDLYLDSDEETASSGDEVQGSGTCAAGSDSSESSYES